MPSNVAILLVCAECGVESEQGVSASRAFLTRDERDGGVDGVELSCAECASEEFGEA